MRKKEFVHEIHKYFYNYFNYLNETLGKLSVIEDRYSFSKNIRVGESPNHYVVELFGFERIKPGEKIHVKNPRVKKISITDDFFIESRLKAGDIHEGFYIDNKYWDYRNLHISYKTKTDDFKKYKFFDEKRFPNIILENANFPISISPRANFIHMFNMKLSQINDYSIIIRRINTILIYKKSINKKELENDLNYIAENTVENSKKHSFIMGLNFYGDEKILSFIDHLLSQTFISAYESDIQDLLETNMELFCNALGYNSAIPHKELLWIDRRDDEPLKSIPDFLLQSKSGYFDILDIKTGIPKKGKLIKYILSIIGIKKRFRFVDEVNELIAQLKEYEKYFSREANVDWASKRGITVKNPKLIGIIGNNINFQEKDVEKALLPFANNIVLINYNTLAELLDFRY